MRYDLVAKQQILPTGAHVGRKTKILFLSFYQLSTAETHNYIFIDQLNSKYMVLLKNDCNKSTFPNSVDPSALITYDICT